MSDKERLVFEAQYSLLREPKRRGGIAPEPDSTERLVARLRQAGVMVKDYVIDVNDYQHYFRQARYAQDFPDYYAFNIHEKSLEHYLAAQFLALNPKDIYIDIASEHSPVPAIYGRLFGPRCYRQDLAYPVGLVDNTIGGDAAAMPVPDGFANKMALHCSFEHFEGDSDMRFIREVARVLKPGGSLCSVPLYLHEEYAIQTDPLISALADVAFEPDAVLYCAEGWNNRHGRFYDPEHFVNRVIANLDGLRLTVYRFVNPQQVHASVYVRFAMVITKPA